MNDRPEVIVDMRDVDVVCDVFRALLSEKWVSLLAPDSEIQRFGMNVMKALAEARANRK